MNDLKKRKSDRRISRTRRGLQEALFALILEKGYESITIEEITTRADLGRTTFYLHYHDKEDLLMQSLSDQVDGLVNRLAQFPLAGTDQSRGPVSDDEVTPLIVLVFQYVAQNRVFYNVLLRGEGTYSAMHRLRQLLTEAIDRVIQHFTQRSDHALKPLVPLEVFINSLAGAWIGLMTWWLEEDLPYTPEQMAVMYQRMFMRSTLETLGIIPS